MEMGRIETGWKKAEIKKLVAEMLQDSQEAMLKNLEKVLTSGAIDIEGWDPDVAPMITPKCIVMALLEQESTQYSGSGTGFQKSIKKEVKNIRYFL